MPPGRELEARIEALEQASAKDAELVIENGGKWEDIGFQRPLGNFFYGVSISIFNSIAGLVLLSVFMGLLYPYPEIQGYYGIAQALFVIIYQVFDTGTAFGIERFIAEWRVKDPERMIKYCQFYIWYQMMTGIVQVFIVSTLVLQVIRFQDLAYLSWIFLIIAQKQWPGMLNIFHSVLNGLQLYDKHQILSLVSGQVFQTLTNIVFILMGRWVGGMLPAYGELVGMAIGSAIGVYVDDFFAMWLAAHYFNKAVQPFGRTARDCFRIGFDRAIMKECLWFGFQVSVVPLVSTASSTWVLLMMIDSIPALATYKALLGLIGGLIGFIDVGNFSLVPSIAESYMNGKKNLARFYIMNSFRWNGYFMMMLSSILLAALPMVMEVFLGLPGLENYTLAIIFFVPALVHRVILPFISYPDAILIGVLKINFYTFSRVFEEGVFLLENFLFMYVFRIQDTFGIQGVVWILAMERFICRNVKMVMMWVYIHKRVFPVAFNWWQMMVAPVLASLPVFVLGPAWKVAVFDPLIPAFSFLGAWAVVPPAAITILVFLTVVPTLVFAPLNGFLGGCDDFGLLTFKKAVALSGPSKPFARIFYKATLAGARRSPWHNKFAIDWENAMVEIKDLMLMKRDHVAKLFQQQAIGVRGVVS